MKLQLAIALVFFSLAARAEFRRLTDLNCTEQGMEAVVMKFDSSISPFIPQVFTINGEKAEKVRMISGDETTYIGMAGFLPFEFKVPSGKKKFQTRMMIDNSAHDLDCKVTTRFRL